MSLTDLPRSAAALSVGALSADLLHLGRDVRRLEAAGAWALHFDVMDGQFCPEFTAGAWLVGAIRTSLVKDVHLMVVEPHKWVVPCVEAGAGIVTVHIESGRHVHRALELVDEASEAAGVDRPLRGLALCPGRSPAALTPLLYVVDIVYVLGINPGWRQSMLAATLDRVHEVRDVLAQGSRPVRLAVDGGVTLANFAEVAAARPDLVVSGSAVFGGNGVEANLSQFAAYGASLYPTDQPTSS
jgi:ribulose-phosphate 3-epimerase